MKPALVRISLTAISLAVSFTILMPATSRAQSAQFKGYVAVSDILSQRILVHGSSLSFSRYVSSYTLLPLLGTWNTGFGSEQVFHNGEPNSVNMLIWYLIFDGFADEVAKTCKVNVSSINPKRLNFNPAFQNALNAVCTWPKPEAKTDSALLGFWTTLMGYSAPESEFLAWKSFLLQSSLKDKPAVEAVKAMTLTLSMNPYFLLQE
jgi:hypothetical protein